MKTVLFYLPSDLIGGAEIQTRLLIQNLPRDKYKPVVAAVPVHHSGKTFIEDLRKVAPVFDIFDDVDLLYVINQFKPDIIQHFHNHRVHPVLKQSGHRCRVIEVVHGRFHFPGDVTTTPKELTDWVVAVGDEAKAFFTKAVPSFSQRTTVIPNGVDLSRFAPLAANRAYDKQKATILHLGRLCEGDKHITKIMDACSAMNVGPSAWKLRIVGEGADRKQIEDHAEQYRGKYQIEFIPHTDIPEMELAKADILVSRSEMEGFGLSIAEGAAAGLPIVAWNCGGVVNYLTSCQDAYIVGGDDAFISALKVLVKDPRSRRTMGTNAAMTAKEMFSATEMAKSYSALYDHLTANPIVADDMAISRDVIGISNPNFTGVTNATVGIVGKRNHYGVLPIEDGYMLMGASDKVFTRNPEVVIIGGGGGYTGLAQHLRLKMPKLKIMLVWHGTLSFNSFAPSDSKILAEYLNLLSIGVINRIGFVRPEIHKVFGHEGCMHFPNRVPPRVVVRKRDLGAGVHVGMFGTSYPWKNHLGMVPYLGKYPHGDVTVHVNKFPHKDLATAMGIKVVEHGDIEHGEFLNLLGSMDLNCMPSFTESMGLTAIESYRVGVPCMVGSNVALTTSIGNVATVRDLDDPKDIWRVMQYLLTSDRVVEHVNSELDALDEENKKTIAGAINGL